MRRYWIILCAASLVVVLAAPSHGTASIRTSRWAECGTWQEAAPAFTRFAPEGIAVVSADEAWVVGGPIYSAGSPIASRWDGASWIRTRVPHDPDAYFVSLHAVAVVSAHEAWAVGVSYKGAATTPFVVRWDGTAWHRTPIGLPGVQGELNGVAAIPGTHRVWAVGTVYFNGGQDQRTLTMLWTGSAWRRVPSANPSDHGDLLYDVTVAGGAAWAVGETYGPDAEYSLILRWNGQRWVAVPSPNPGRDEVTILQAIEGTARDAIWAVGWYSGLDGSDHALILRWNGRSWSVAEKVPGRTRLNDLVIASRRSAWAVGDIQLRGGKGAPLVLRRHAGRWERSPAPRPHLPNSTSLIAIDGTPKNLWTALRIHLEEGSLASAYHRC